MNRVQGPLDVAEFEACWHSNLRRVVGYAERHVGREAAYDVASATFLTAWRSWSAVPDPALPWLIAVAKGHVRNHLRGQRRRQGLEDRLALLSGSAYDGPDTAVSALERAEALAALAALPESDCEALLLVAWEGLTPEQAAEVLGIRHGTLRMRLHRARSRLSTSEARSIPRSAT